MTSSISLLPAFFGIVSILVTAGLVIAALKLRPPGRSILRKPLFIASALAAILATPLMLQVLATSAIMFTDNDFSEGFFDPSGDGDPVLSQHLTWFAYHLSMDLRIFASWALTAVGAIACLLLPINRWARAGTAMIYTPLAFFGHFIALSAFA